MKVIDIVIKNIENSIKTVQSELEQVNQKIGELNSKIKDLEKTKLDVDFLLKSNEENTKQKKIIIVPVFFIVDYRIVLVH